MHEETKGQDGHHDVYDAGGHKIASEFEQAVTLGEQVLICSYNAVFAGKAVDHREKVDGSVEQEEQYEESSADGLNEFLADG